MGFAIAVVIIVGFLVSVWRSMPHDVDTTTGGHWSTGPSPTVPEALPVIPADVDVHPSSAPTPARRSAALVDPDVLPDPIRRRAPLVESVDVDSAPEVPEVDPDVETTVDEADEGEVDPDPLDETTPYDAKRCWGCSKRCTYRAFRLPEGGTRDEIHRRAEILFRAEHGCASDLDQIDGSDVARVSLSAEELDFDPIAVAKAVGESKRRAWFELCEQCVDDLRARRDNPPDPIVEPAAVVAAAEECPF
ncbi:MAG: hypothetical protein WC565_09360 [Parcubacteria group bacterium]